MEPAYLPMVYGPGLPSPGDITRRIILRPVDLFIVSVMIVLMIGVGLLEDRSRGFSAEGVGTFTAVEGPGQ